MEETRLRSILARWCALAVCVALLGVLPGWANTPRCAPLALESSVGGTAQPAPAADGQDTSRRSEAWVDMPAGARQTYIGINGGTVPVSLLTARDGQSMATFVGLTGNDFLRLLHQNTRFPTPNGKNATSAASGQPPSNNATVLMASTAIGNIPVFYCTGQIFSRLGDEEWLPFGLSEDPLQLEGQVDRPLMQGTRTKKYRRFLLMQRLQRPTLSTH